MPDINPNDRQAEFARIAARRKAMLDAEDEMRQKRADEKKEVETRGKSAFQDEMKASAARGAKREEWRQGRHEKERQDIAEKHRREEAQKAELLKEEKKKEFRQEQKEDMAALHALAVKKNREERAESIEKEAYNREKQVESTAGRDHHAADADLERALVSIGRELRKKEDALVSGLMRRKKMLEDSYEEAKRMLLQEEKKASGTGPMSREAMNLGHERMQLESEHKRQLMRLEKEEETERMKLKQEKESLEREAKTYAAQKHARAGTDHDRLLRETRQRRDTALGSIGFGSAEKGNE